MTHSSNLTRRTRSWVGRAGWLTVLALSLFLLGPTARADLIATEDVTKFGTFSQLNAGVTGTDALRGESCVPTSVANGLAFLNNINNVPNLMQPGYGTVNALSTAMGTTNLGTSYPGMVTGTAAYIGPTGQNVSPPVNIVGGQVAPTWGTVAGFNIQNNTNPTAMQLYNWLIACDAVEFWINWSTGGAHSLTLYGIDINTDINGNATGTGTLSFLDPFGGAFVAGGNAGSAVNIPTATFTTVGGQLFINGGYTGGAANNGADPDNLGRSSTGYIVTDLAEAVPEPSSVILVMMSALPIGSVVLVRKLRKAS